MDSINQPPARQNEQPTTQQDGAPIDREDAAPIARQNEQEAAPHLGARNARTIVFLCLSAITLLLALLIGPLDFFTHGYYCDETDMEDERIERGKPQGLASGVSVRFSPSKRHFAGFEVYMARLGTGDSGELRWSIADGGGSVIEEASVPLSDISKGSWYKVYSGARLRQGSEYVLTLRAEGSSGSPAIATARGACLGGELLERDDSVAAVAFAYEKSTFGITEKTLLILFLAAAWLYMAGCLAPLPGGARRAASAASAFLLLTGVLAWNGIYNTFDRSSGQFDSFPYISDNLVKECIIADGDGVAARGYGGMRICLMNYETVTGDAKAFLTDGEWEEGYSVAGPRIILSSCPYTRDMLSQAESVRFSSGDALSIKGYEDDGTYVTVRLDATGALCPRRYGSLSDMRLIGGGGEVLPAGYAREYRSQFGLQGMACLLLSRFLGGEEGFPILYMIFSLATAATLCALVFLLREKCGLLYAAVSYAVFLLSPWVAGLSRCLYWAEFTWFLPMAAGLLCTLRGEGSRRWRVLCCVAVFATVAAKCLCGYEYVTSVMLGAVAFPLADFFLAVAARERERARKLFAMTFSLGVAALLGFAAALCLHAVLRGDGNVAAGIASIIREDALRRTSGGNLNDFPSGYWPSLNASRWDVLCKYFHFETEIIAGIPGSLFPLLCLAPLAIFFAAWKKGRLDLRLPVMYAVFFCVAASWFVLAKEHSYVHTFLNFVLWYMGFVQVCLYVVARWILKATGWRKGDGISRGCPESARIS